MSMFAVARPRAARDGGTRAHRDVLVACLANPDIGSRGTLRRLRRSVPEITALPTRGRQRGAV